MAVIQNKRKYIKKETKKKIREALKICLVKWYVYSYNELYRIGLEYREIQDYILPLCNVKIISNKNGWNPRKNLTLKKEVKKILNESISEVIIFQNEETIKLIKLLF